MCNVAAVVIQWNTNASGSFGVQGNWDPMQVPGLNDVVRFDRDDQSYTVSLGGINRTSFVLVIADDAVTFDLQVATYEMAGVVGQPSAVIIGESAGSAFLFTDTASLNVADGMLMADRISLGATAQINNFPPPAAFLASGTLNINGSADSSDIHKAWGRVGVFANYGWGRRIIRRLGGSFRQYQASILAMIQPAGDEEKA